MLGRTRSFIATLALATLPAAHADEGPRLRALVDGVIQPLMSRYDLPGMAVGVVVDGRRHVFNYGVAARAAGMPVTDTTLFEIGSVSKTLTATLVTYAQATGRLSLDDHPGKHLPQLRGAAIDAATLLHLGTYTAGGLPLQFPDAVQGDAAVMDYFRHWQPDTAPGSTRHYSNPSIGLAGRVAAAALGEGFASAMASTVFPAFGMASSFIHVPAPRLPDYAWGHRGNQQIRVNPGPLDAEAYGVKTTAADLLHFVQAQIDPGALTPTMRQAVRATQVGHFRAGPMVQGLGWEQYPYPVSREWLLGGNAAEVIWQPQPVQQLPTAAPDTPRLFNKTGSTNGFGAYVAFVPSRRVGIVMLANRSYPIPARVEAGWAVLEQLAAPVK